MPTRKIIAGAAALALTGTTAGAALMGATTASGQTAHKAAPTVTVIARHLVGPLSVAQAPDGTRYWTDSFAGPLYRQLPNGQPTVIFPGSKKGGAAEGVSADGGMLRFTTGSSNNSKGSVWTLDPVSGAPVEIADTGKYEKSTNPDGNIRYGFRHISATCLSKVPEQIPGAYRGVKETHPYATAWANGITYVADAGANAVFAVSPLGEISTVAVIKPVKVKITRSGAKANNLPRCTVGKRYAFESVPTDIEVGPDGFLYVTSLPGGPEDGSLGANGRVLKVNPTSGKVTTIARGLVTPTGVAVASNGDIYVAQLFAGVILKKKASKSKFRPYLRLRLPAAVEAIPTGLLATRNALPGKKPKGQVVTITP